MTRKFGTAALIGLMATACGDDSGNATAGSSGSDTGTMTTTTTAGTGSSSGATTTTTTTTMGTTDGTTSMGTGPMMCTDPADFTITIENISGTSLLATPFSPGVWFTHTDMNVLFEDDMADRGEGLEQLAEDGDPTTLAASLMANASAIASGTFGMMPIGDGEMYEFTVTATPSERVSFATMLVASNDLVVAPGGGGLALFDNLGCPRDSRDVTDFIRLWDSGTEVNQAPGQGPDQPPTPGGGVELGGVRSFSNGTRAMPLAELVADVQVVDDGAGQFTVTIDNVSGANGTLVTLYSDAVWANHGDTYNLFAAGGAASPGIEALAEDGESGTLAAEVAGAAEVVDSGVVIGPTGPGQQVVFSVTPNATYPNVSFATMIVESNDAFLALGPTGVAFLDGNGMPRPVSQIEDDIRNSLAIWDAGTEANEVPGAGPNQVLRQAALDTGPADPDPTIRLYRDGTNDLTSMAGFASVTVGPGMVAGEFTITVSNDSGTHPYRNALTPMVWALHDDATDLFAVDMPASLGLESQAEDGDPMTLFGELSAAGGVDQTAIVNIPDGAMTPGPIGPGDTYSFAVIPAVAGRNLSIATMIAGSNDTFLAFAPAGVPLLDAGGAPRALVDIQADIDAALQAWDAATEVNQSGAAGGDQPANQAAANTGAAEGTGLVMQVDDQWAYPELDTIIRVTIAPAP